MPEIPPVVEVLEVLACEIGVRPAAAPTFDDLAPSLRGLTRDAGAITLEFDAGVRDKVEQLAAAERLCCAGIDWLVTTDPLRLRIGAAPAQLDVLEAMFRQDS